MSSNGFLLFSAAIATAGSHASELMPLRQQHPPEAEAQCRVPPGWSQVAASSPRYVVFGEVHGTREAPAFVGTLTCGLAAAGKQVLVAVEHDAIHNSALQDAWQLPEEAFADALPKVGWAGRMDGIASEAMFKLLRRLHGLKTQGRPIDVVAFNGFSDEAQQQRLSHLPAQGPHEAAQAENIRKAAKKRQYDLVIVLVGNIHARKTAFEQRGVSFEPMAMQLGSSKEVTTLNMMHGKGSAWNCLLKPNIRVEHGKPLPPGAMDCGIHSTGASGRDLGPVPLIKLGAFPGHPPDPSYDGFFWLGPVSGSPPAVPEPAP